MKMTFRWYGSQMDPIPLRYIKQIPNMSGVVSSSVSYTHLTLPTIA